MTCCLSSAVFHSSSSLWIIQICSQEKSTKVLPSNSSSKFQWWSSEMKFGAGANLSCLCFALLCFTLLCRKCSWLSNPFDLWSLTEMKQTMRYTSCFFYFLALSILFWGNTTLPLEKLVTCVVCCPDRYICHKCAFNLRNNSWLEFIPLSWGICQTFESLANRGLWMIHHSGCPCPVQRQRCWHTRLFSEKSRFLWDMESYYLDASFSLVIEMIHHHSDIRFGFKVQHRYSCCVFCCPRLVNLMQEWNQRVFLHVCCGFCWMLSPVQMDPSRRYVQLCSPGSATFAGGISSPHYQKKEGLICD